jgi:hypothetical protein
MHLEAGGPRVSPPIVATHLVKLACELPEDEASRKFKPSFGMTSLVEERTR